MLFCIDRFEGDLCILQADDDSMHEFSRHLIPAGATEGTWLTQVDGVFHIDAAETERVAARIRDKMNRLWQ